MDFCYFNANRYSPCETKRPAIARPMLLCYWSTATLRVTLAPVESTRIVRHPQAHKRAPLITLLHDIQRKVDKRLKRSSDSHIYDVSLLFDLPLLARPFRRH